MSDKSIYRAVIGTNSWGRKAYGKVLRGSSVDKETLRKTVSEAMDRGLVIFDTAQDYGLGQGQKLIGELCPKEAMISAKYTPGKKYVKGQVKRSFEKDLKDFKRDYVDIYWLHLPNCIEENLSEMIGLYKEGKIGNIGISNFSLDECRLAKELLDKEGVPLFGVQNHYSILARDWEKNGLLDWCRENGVQFWAWAVLEEGLLVPPKKGSKLSAMKLFYLNRQSKLLPLYKKMHIIGKRHGISPAQVAMAFCTSKGIVPICGCRKPYQAADLDIAAEVTLSDKEISVLEQTADSTGVKILGADMFRFAVKKNRITDKKYKELTLNEFTKAAEVYETDKAGVYKMCKKDYPDVLAELEKEPFTDLLDCGCGTAPMLTLLHEKYPEKHYTGIDLTPKMIEVARAKNMDGVELVVGDCENLPFEDSSFDVVICCQSFHHYPNVQNFFDSVYRVLRPNGRLILRDMTADTVAARWFMNNIEMPVINLAGHGDVHVYGKDEVESLCTKAGLRLESFEKRGFLRLHCVARKPNR